MKKLLLIMMAFMTSFGAYAQEVNTENEDNSNNFVEDWRISDNPELGYKIYHEYEVYSNNITLPFVVQVPVPPTGTLVQVNGPATPNVPNWSVSNGTLTITYTYMDQVEAFLRSGICYIETRVVPGPENVYPYRNYAIRVIVY